MYLSGLCSAKNAVFTGFVKFPQLYPPKTKTPAHLHSQYNLMKVIGWGNFYMADLPHPAVFYPFTPFSYPT